ncbi:ATP-binding protein [Photobacterium damselae]|nr:AAA family ATPase [Photobacterium damselae]AWK84533.1 hypothetical protein BST98_21095 [Photobacterium damselae]MBE8127806.1 AAA family ATPase [Photobacterium damselae subsp. piscicida]NVO60206.1 AAA family ATPase [Photobacterium damselae subsp. damselae]NVP03033.1 AAA family ATPase [Photobacterium damselae subsp. damselae]WIH21825.1 AAA family ATPase [Photobacterium damselae]
MTNIAVATTTQIALPEVITKEFAATLDMDTLVSLLERKDPEIEDVVYSDKRWQEKENVDAHDLFDIVPKGVFTLARFKYRHPKCVASNPHYIPQREVLKRMMGWWCSVNRPVSLYLYGETGTGKTEMVQYFADKMNWPLSIMQVTEYTRSDKAQGSYILHNGKTPFRYGPVSQAMKYGWCLILDELDKGNGDFLCKLHNPVEGKPMQLDDTGEIILPNVNFRCLATGNTSGGGDMTGRYLTSNRLDEAFRRRFGFIKCDYPGFDTEVQILQKRYPDITTKTVRRMCRFATEIRKALQAPEIEARCVTPEELAAAKLPSERLGCAFSTRLLVAWAEYINVFGRQFTPLIESFNFVFGESLDEEDRPAVYAILQRVFGEAINHPDEWTDGAKK